MAELGLAAGTLASLRGVLATPGDDSLGRWRRVNLGRFIAREHYDLAGVLADAGRPEEAGAVPAAADAVLGELSEAGAEGLRELVARTAARVRRVS